VTKTFNDVNVTLNDQDLRTLRNDELDLVNGGDILNRMIDAAIGPGSAWYQQHVADCPLPRGTC
jgi:hypothetical protein